MRPTRLALSWAMLFLYAGPAASDEPKPEERREVSKNLAPAGTLLQREKGKDWRAASGVVFSGDRLLVLPGSRADLKIGDVELSLWGNVPEFYPLLVLESEVTLHASSEVALDFTLARGRVLLAGKEGAQIRVRSGGKSYDLKLTAAGTTVALELYGRWPIGTPFALQRKPEVRPVAVLRFFVLKGQADLKVGADQFLMPASSSFHWDNVDGADPKPKRADQPPSWVADKPTTAEAKDMEGAIARLRQRLAEQPVDKVLTDALVDANANTRELAVFGLAAIDDLPRLADALADVRHANVRETAITALRHWLGLAPTNDLRLYRLLVEQWKYTPAQAETVLHLLLGFRESDRDQPETYETLIEYLRHSKRSIRELARWQLYRWVLAGRDIPYNAASTPAEYEKAYKAWKQLIPEGKVPPKSKSEGK